MVGWLSKFARSAVLALMAMPIVTAAQADVISYSSMIPAFSSLGNTLQTLGYDPADPAQQVNRETFTTPGAPGNSVRLDFTFVRDVGSYQFSFGVFDLAAVTADPATARETWGSQALAAATEIFDNRNVSIGDTASLEVASGAQLGWFLIPNDMLETVLADPEGFYDGGRSEPLFSVSTANPGGFDQLLTFETGGLTALAFEDLSRAGGSDQDFNDLVVTMRTTLISGSSIETAEVSEPAFALLMFFAAIALVACRRQQRNRS